VWLVVFAGLAVLVTAAVLVEEWLSTRLNIERARAAGGKDKS
jgi:hypothetical protein